MRCLIVDDDVFCREIMVSFVEDFTDILDIAKNGAEAVELFSKALIEGKPYDLVCLDIVMPTMNGQEALKRMRSIENEQGLSGKPAVIVMATAVDSLKDIQEAIWDGNCTDYLLKPVCEEDLKALLKKYNLITC